MMRELVGTIMHLCTHSGVGTDPADPAKCLTNSIVYWQTLQLPDQFLIYHYH